MKADYESLGRDARAFIVRFDELARTIGSNASLRNVNNIPVLPQQQQRRTLQQRQLAERDQQQATRWTTRFAYVVRFRSEWSSFDSWWRAYSGYFYTYNEFQLYLFIYLNNHLFRFDGIDEDRLYCIGTDSGIFVCLIDGLILIDRCNLGVVAGGAFARATAQLKTIPATVRTSGKAEKVNDSFLFYCFIVSDKCL